ncbi:hypothetical protein [Lyngbya aestuarii]|uniref:hypothetical protein n=1 Tax=Lyngbya aestuarii TaxID=118322 RepID=UPI00403E0F55
MSSSEANSIKIKVTTKTSHQLLEGLAVWRILGLLADTQVSVEIITNNDHPELLAGLDAWLRLGLVDQAAVKKLCRENLTCALPIKKTVPSASQPVRQLPNVSTRVASTASVIPPPSKPKPSWLTQRLQSLQAELSLRWLLFLGVFMVVVSSGVLAASQWANFPATGQYGVLLGYTLTFWGVSYWAAQQSNLRLTSQTLQIVTLLLVPVNFWAMDGFGLWRNPIDLMVMAVATVILSIIVFLLWRLEQRPSLPIFNYLGLSYLHWGWSVLGFPLVAVYLGIGSTLAIFYAKYSRSNASFSLALSLLQIAVYGIGVLLFRAIFIAGVELQQLGLALGICGCFLSWLSQKSEDYKNSQQKQSTQPARYNLSPIYNSQNFLAAGLLFLGWLVSVGVEFPWQATAVSGLGLWFFSNHLKRFWQQKDLAAIFVISLQMIWLAWRLIPGNIQTQMVATATELSSSQNTPFALLSLAIFPYLILTVGVIDWLYRLSKRHLAKFTETTALFLGIALTILSLVNPLLRTLNLFNSTITLGIVSWQRNQLGIPHNPQPLIYLTHLLGIGTIVSTIDYFLPNLNLESWAAIVLLVMIIEWGFSLGIKHLVVSTQVSEKLRPTIYSTQSPPLRGETATYPHWGIWQDSAWYIGLGLASLSYGLIWTNHQVSISHGVGNLLWLITPISLTLLATQTSNQRQKSASWLSIVALVVVQFLTLGIPGTQLISLGVATALMLVNTRCWQQLIAAVITVGFALSFLAVLLLEGIPELPALSASGWLITVAIASTSLWLFRSLASRRSTQLAQIYTKAADGWAIALCSLELIILTLHSILVYWGFISPTVGVVIAGVVTLGAIAYRSLPQPNNWAIYAMGWSWELLAAEILGFIEHPLINLAVVNLAFGLIFQLAGDWWQRRRGVSNLPSSWHIIPLLYGILGAALRWGLFTSWTGLFSLTLAVIALGIGRRREQFKPLVYLALFGISVAAYELLFYQFSQASGGATGDALIVMAALGTGIMYAYRILSPWLKSYARLSREELKVIAHLHWVWSSCLLIAATTYPIAAKIMVGLGTGAFLIQYAIFEGRNNTQLRIGEIWVYLGFAETFAMRIYWLNTPIASLFSGPLVPWKSAVASVFAYFLYFLPWESWGWSKRPWQLAGIIVPLIAVGESPLVNNPASLLIVAAFYIWLAIVNRQIRFTYLSALLIDLVFLRWFWQLQLRDPLWYIIPLGLSLLYIAQVDPSLIKSEQKQARHNLRLLGCGVICLVALWSSQWSGLVPGVVSIVAIFAGLALRIRAFLYVGTATFLINAFYQLGILIFDYSFSKWVVGLVVGIMFIWIAATFETRRHQITALLRHWVDELHSWD